VRSVACDRPPPPPIHLRNSRLARLAKTDFRPGNGPPVAANQKSSPTSPYLLETGWLQAANRPAMLDIRAYECEQVNLRSRALARRHWPSTPDRPHPCAVSPRRREMADATIASSRASISEKTSGMRVANEALRSHGIGLAGQIGSQPWRSKFPLESSTRLTFTSGAAVSSAVRCGHLSAQPIFIEMPRLLEALSAARLCRQRWRDPRASRGARCAALLLRGVANGDSESACSRRARSVASSIARRARVSQIRSPLRCDGSRCNQRSCSIR